MISTESLGRRTEARSPLAQLLHALNQPLTGLQCSMEVALAIPRTREQYVQGLREGLALTERMRVLVAAIREVADCEERTEPRNGEPCSFDCLLRGALNDFAPVAETKRVRIVQDLKSISSVMIGLGRSRMEETLLRLLDWILNEAAPGTSLRVTAEPGETCVALRMCWQPQAKEEEWSGEDVGYLVLQAQVRSAGGEWERERREDAAAITLRLPCLCSQQANV
jgi:signal transduction histidine kinase